MSEFESKIEQLFEGRNYMKNYKVTMFNIINGEPQFYSVNVSCTDAATEIWLNPQFKHVYKVEEI